MLVLRSIFELIITITGYKNKKYQVDFVSYIILYVSLVLLVSAITIVYIVVYFLMYRTLKQLADIVIQ